MIFVDQSYTQLQLGLYDGDVDLSALQILVQKNVEITPVFQLKAGIIGASHFIKIQYKNRCFTEVFACALVEDTSCLSLYRAPFSKLQTLEMNPLPRLSYQFNHQFNSFKKQASINKNLQQRVNQLSAKGIYLSYNFPSITEQVTTARTVVVTDVNKELSEITTFTIHEYPEEQVIVTNESCFKIR